MGHMGNMGRMVFTYFCDSDNKGDNKKNDKELFFWQVTLKPIFHCDVKLLALGTFALPEAKDDTFAKLWYLYKPSLLIWA